MVAKPLSELLRALWDILHDTALLLTSATVIAIVALVAEELHVEGIRLWVLEGVSFATLLGLLVERMVTVWRKIIRLIRRGSSPTIRVVDGKLCLGTSCAHAAYPNNDDCVPEPLEGLPICCKNSPWPGDVVMFLYHNLKQPTV